MNQIPDINIPEWKLKVLSKKNKRDRRIRLRNQHKASGIPKLNIKSVPKHNTKIKIKEVKQNTKVEELIKYYETIIINNQK